MAHVYVVERDRRTGGCRNDQKSGAVLAWTKGPSFCAESLSIIRGKKVSKSLLCDYFQSTQKYRSEEGATHLLHLNT